MIISNKMPRWNILKRFISLDELNLTAYLNHSPSHIKSDDAILELSREHLRLDACGQPIVVDFIGQQRPRQINNGIYKCTLQENAVVTIFFLEMNHYVVPDI